MGGSSFAVVGREPDEVEVRHSRPVDDLTQLMRIFFMSP